MNKLREGERTTTGGVLPLLRRAAAALRGSPERATLAASLNEFMQLVPALRAAWVELPAASGASAAGGAAPFSGDALTLPLRAGAEVTGVLRHHLDGPPLDGERLRVLGAVAELLGAILEQTSHHTAAAQARALLALVLENMPFGAACFSPAGQLLAANPAVLAFAGGPDALAPLLLRPESGAVAGTPGPAVHLARVGDRMALVHVHRGMTADAGAAGAVALVFDLGQRAREFLGAVARETYRALWLGRPLTLAVLAAPNRPAELLRIAEAIRLRLPPTAENGPLDSDAVGILAPETNLTTLRAIVRGTTGLELVPELRLGLAELEREHRTPELFVTAAVGALASPDRLRRPSLLLCDTSPSVTEALQVALRADCDAVRCHDRDAGWRLLGERSFDAIFAKVELDEWDRDIGFLRHALELQPGLKAFIMTDAAGLYSATIPQLPAGTPVFRKPFQVAAVRNAVREQLAQRGDRV